MNINEKLEHFENITIEEAKINSNKIIEDYILSLDKILEEHKKEKLRQAALQLKTESEQLERKKNTELAKEQLLLKRFFNKQQNDLREKLFVELKDLLGRFTDTREYNEMLIRQIKKAKEFAREDEITIYIDLSDSSKLNSLQVATNTNLTVSEYSFLGGTRAVIPSRNILIDNSFETKLAELEAEFTFDFDGGSSNE